jgi:hypothetical protein
MTYGILLWGIASSISQRPHDSFASAIRGYAAYMEVSMTFDKYDHIKYYMEVYRSNTLPARLDHVARTMTILHKCLIAWPAWDP